MAHARTLGYSPFDWFTFEQPGAGCDLGVLTEPPACSGGGDGVVAIGVRDSVLLFDRSLKEVGGFAAHGRVLHVLVMESGNVLTMGMEASDTPVLSIKLWPSSQKAPKATLDAATQLPKPLREHRLLLSNAAPGLSKGSERVACVTARALPDASLPQAHAQMLYIGIVTTAGCLLTAAGEPEKGSVRLCGKPLEAGTAGNVNLVIGGREDRGATLYVVTEEFVHAYPFQAKGGVHKDTRVLLDDGGGAARGCVALTPNDELVVARREQGSGSSRTMADRAAVGTLGERSELHYYTPTCKTECYVAPGLVVGLEAAGQYLFLVTDATLHQQAHHELVIVDCKGKIRAGAFKLRSPSNHMVPAFGGLLVVRTGSDAGPSSGRAGASPRGAPSPASPVLCLERPLEARLADLTRGGQYETALATARASGATESVSAALHKAYADHLMARGDLAAAMTHFIETIGHLEASYVIRQFLDVQKIGSLTGYLEALHERSAATADHTTLLLNCYTRLQDVDKLRTFVNGSETSFDFHRETAVKVLRQANLSSYALTVAKAMAVETGDHTPVMDILLDDVRDYPAATTYMSAHMGRQQRARVLQRSGKLLLGTKMDAVAAVMELCVPVSTSSIQASAGEADPDTYVAAVADFTHMFVDRPMALLTVCEFVLREHDVRGLTPPKVGTLYHTLLELNVAPDLEDVQEEVRSLEHRRTDMMKWLAAGWQLGQQPKYDVDHAINICRIHDFTEGIVFLYSRQQMYREVLQVYMDQGLHDEIVEACRTLGPDPGTDPELWMAALRFFSGAVELDCSPQVQAILQHFMAVKASKGIDLVEPGVVLTVLAANPKFTLSVVKEYFEASLEGMSAKITENQREIARYQKETSEKKTALHKLKTEPIVFQQTKDFHSGADLQLPAVHFLCNHAFSENSLTPEFDGTYRCPHCRTECERLMEIRAHMSGPNEPERFCKELGTARDGFAVVAKYLGRGLVGGVASTASSDPVHED